MPQLPIPQRGQPLDVSYINDIVTTINTLITDTSTKPSNTTLIVSGDTKKSSPTSKAHIYGETKNIANATAVTAGQEASFDINFSYPFATAPIVVATPWNKGGTDSGKNVSVYVSDVTTSKATIVAKFSSNGSATVDVNVLVIGIPN